MKKLNVKIILMSLLVTGLLVQSGTVYADFEDIGIGARPIAMGNAFVGLADDANSIYYNPAGLGLLTRKELTSTYGRLFMGLTDGSNISDGFIGYVHPINKKTGTVGVGWLNLSLRDNTAWISATEEKSITRYAENGIYMSYGRDMTDLSGKYIKKLLKLKVNIPGSLSAGLNMKLMVKSYGIDGYSLESGADNITDPVFGTSGERNTKLITSYDLGLFYRSDNYHTSFGMALTDINFPETVLAKDIQSPVTGSAGDFRRLPAGLRVGLAYREPVMNIVLDFKMKAGDFDIHTGIERWFHGKDMAIRAGFTHGSRALNNISLGACYKYAERYQFDYVFLYTLSGLKNIYGTHRLSISMQFGELTEEREIRKQAEKATEGINKAKKAKKEKLMRFDYLRDKFLQRFK